MSDDAASVLADLERRRYDAMRDSDHAVLAQLCDDELTYTHSDGTSDTKETYLQRIRDGYFDYRRLEHDTDRTLLVGDCALLFGRMSGEVLIGGALRRLNSVSLVVWVRRADGWRFLAFQPTPLR